MEVSQAVGRVLRESYGLGVIAFDRVLGLVAGSATGGLFLSQAAWLSKNKSDEEGWFACTQAQWQESTMLTRYEQESVRAKLREIEVLEEDKRGIPAKLFFRVNFERIGEIVASLYVEKPHPGMGKTSTQAWGKTTSTYRKGKDLEKTTSENIATHGESPLPDGSAGGDPPVSESPEQPVKPSREERDAMWEALVVATGVDPATRGEKSNQGAVVRSLLEAGYTPRHVRVAVKEWHRIWEGRTITVNAIEKHISTLLISRKDFRDGEKAENRQPIV